MPGNLYRIYRWFFLYAIWPTLMSVEPVQCIFLTVHNARSDVSISYLTGINHLFITFYSFLFSKKLWLVEMSRKKRQRAGSYIERFTASVKILSKDCIRISPSSNFHPEFWKFLHCKMFKDLNLDFSLTLSLGASIIEGRE